jgi:transcriptional regulator with XRE-family HTH domain
MTVNDAIRELRKHVGKTQQIFATELGISISSLSNYEREREPEPKQLFRFERAAADAGRSDLSMVFRDALEKSLGVEHGETALFQSRDRFETIAISTLLLCIRGGTEGAGPLIEAVAAAIKSKDKQKFTAEAIRRGYHA